MSSTDALKYVIEFKILFTFGLIALLCLVPGDWYKSLGIPSVPFPLVFARLLGAAYIALVVGYIQGVTNLNAGKSSLHAVWIGIVSNGLAFLILLYFGVVKRAWADWKNPARIGFWGCTGAVLFITVGLIWAGLIAGGARGKIG